MKRFSNDNNIKINKVLNKRDLLKIQKEIQKIHVDENIYSYIKDLIFCSRENKEIKRYLIY
jgi:hypothetical protein